jgi:GTP:adenosylcobinamide-phosphate guanylyltransferase
LKAGFNALVLAGTRPGARDPVADYAGVAHKGLIELGGLTLLERVVTALREAGAARIGVSTNDPAIMAAATALDCEPLAAEAGPSQSVHVGADALGAPLLVTTVDHALLRPEWVTRFMADAPADADVCALVAARPAVEAAAPGTQRTWIKLADGDWSGCNLFWIANDRGLRVVDLWRRVEADRKKPWKIAALLGPGLLLRYVTGRLSLDAIARGLGRLAGCEARIVATPYGLAAVDVDKPADLDLVRRLVPEV